MTENEYWEKVHQAFAEHIKDAPSGNAWRWGQTCMNVLRDVNPGLYHLITGSPADPWNADVNSQTYQTFVKIISEQEWS